MSFLKRLFGKEAEITKETVEAPLSVNDRDVLPDNVHAQITAHSAEGDRLVENEKYQAAIDSYKAAWELLPEPKNHWSASTWLIAALADSYFLLGDNEAAREALEFGMTCPDAIGNPFLHLRLGQVQFDTGNEDQAADELMRAYMGGGPEVFEVEDERYLAFLKTRAIIND